METVTRISINRILVAVLALISVTSANAWGQEDKELRYLFAGMSQERAKLKSWLCTIKGMDKKKGTFDMKFLSDGENVWFSRTSRLIPSAPEETVKACANKTTIVLWNVAKGECLVMKSTPADRDLLHLWDPRTAGLVLDPGETEYQQVIENYVTLWQSSSKIHHNGELRTVTFTHPHQSKDVQFNLTIDTQRGFTPLLNKAEIRYKPNSKFPDKTEVNYEVTAKWEEHNSVWVPIYAADTSYGDKRMEYDISWEWVNQDIKENAFTIDGLGVPSNVKMVYKDNGKAVFRNDFTTDETFRRKGIGIIRWVIISSIAVILVAVWLFRRHQLSRKNAN